MNWRRKAASTDRLHLGQYCSLVGCDVESATPGALARGALHDKVKYACGPRECYSAARARARAALSARSSSPGGRRPAKR